MRRGLVYSTHSGTMAATVTIPNRRFFRSAEVCAIAGVKPYVLNSWADFEGSIEERGLHAVYLLKTCIWLFAGLLILQGVATVVRTTRLLRCPEDPAP